MELSAEQYLAVGLIVFASSVVQGTVGFASGLFGIPLLLLAGLKLPQAMMINLVAAFFQNLVGSYKLRGDLELSRTLRPIAIRFATLPLGMYALYLASNFSPEHIKQLVGLMLLGIVLLQKAWRVEPREELHPAWEWIAFSTSGFVAGLCAMGGPMMVLWVMAHDWTAARSRAFLFFVFAVGMVPQAVGLWWLFGSEVSGAALLGIMGIAIMLVGTSLGLRIGHHLPIARLRQLSYALLVLIALSAIVSPLF